MKRRTIIVAAILLSALGVVLGISVLRTLTMPWHGGDADRDGAAITPADLATIASNTGITLPPRVRGEHFRWLGSGIDPGFYAKLRAPATPTTEAQLLASINALPNQRVLISTGQDPVWWISSSIAPGAILAERTFTLRNGCTRIVLCKEEGELVIYVKWFSV